MLPEATYERAGATFSREGSSGDRALERQFDDHLNNAMHATLQGRHDDARRYSGTALAISRELYRSSANPARHRPALTESGEHYQALADDNPDAFEVRRIDVLVRTGLTLRASGDQAAAADRFREAIRQYQDARAEDPVERDLGLARAHFHLGRSLLELATLEEALAEIDKGLLVAERVREEAGIPAAADFSWLNAAPRSFQLIAPDWIAAAVCAMELHDAAGRWGVAADAANIAVRVCGGMAALGGPGYRQLYEATLARARTIWQHAQDPVRATMEQTGPTQEVLIGSGKVLFATPDLAAIFRATGWIAPR